MVCIQPVIIGHFIPFVGEMMICLLGTNLAKGLSVLLRSESKCFLLKIHVGHKATLKQVCFLSSGWPKLQFKKKKKILVPV